MPRWEPTPLETPDQTADIYEQLRRLTALFGSGGGIPRIVTSLTRPTSPIVGDVIYESDTSSLLIWDGFAWRPPWNQPWGRVADVKITNTNLGLINADLPGFAVSWLATKDRRYTISAVGHFQPEDDAVVIMEMQDGNATRLGYVEATVQAGTFESLAIAEFEWIAPASTQVSIKIHAASTPLGAAGPTGEFNFTPFAAKPAWLHVNDEGPATVQSAPGPGGTNPPPPTGSLGVAITTPTSTAVITAGQPVQIGAAASAAGGFSISKVDFFIDGASIASDAAAPYTANWSNPTAGQHAITATVTQSDGATAQSASVIVNVTGGSTNPPPPTGTTKLTVQGRLLKDPAGATVSLAGLNQYIVPAFVDSSNQMGPLTNWFDSNLGRVADDWVAKGINCVRIPVMKDTNQGYTQRVVNAVNTLGQKGLYAILTPYDANTFGVWPSSAPMSGGGGTGGTGGTTLTPTFSRSLSGGSFYDGSTWNTTDGSSWNFEVLTPGAGKTVIALVVTYESSSNPVTPTAAGLGMTWFVRATTFRTVFGNSIRATLFTGTTTGTPIGTTFTVQTSATQTGVGIQLAEFSDVDQTTPLVVTSGGGTLATTATITAAQAPSSGCCWAGFARNVQEGTSALGSGWVGIGADWGASPGDAHITMRQAGNPTSASATYFSTGGEWVGFFAEVKGATTGGTPPPPPTSGQQNDVAVSSAQFLQTLWTACGKPPHLMLELWHEPVGTALTPTEWKSGAQAGIGVLRTAGAALYDGPIFITTRNWGWSFDATEAAAIKAADANVVFSTHRYAVVDAGAPPLDTADPATWRSFAVDAAVTAGVPLFMGAWGIAQGGFGAGGSKTLNTQQWAAAMASELQAQIAAGKLVGEAAWMWLWGGAVAGEDSENSFVDPLWQQVVAGTTWTSNVWGQLVYSLTASITGGSPPPPPPPPPPTGQTFDNWELEVSGTGFINKSGQRTVLRGVAQYLLEYTSGGSGASALYSWFSSHIDQVALDWKQKGVNFVRIPITYNTGAAYINDLKDKVDSLFAQGIMSQICAFDGSWGAYNSNTAPDRMAQVWGLIGSPRYCFIESNNEPNGITAAQWQSGMQNWVARLRAAGYKGTVFLGARDWSWTFDPANAVAIRNADTNTGGKAGNVCIVNHTYAVTEPANPVQPANYGTATWKPMWPDQAGPQNVCFIINEWGPWNGAPCTAFGQGGSYASNIDGWGENMRTEIQAAVQAQKMAGACGWMWAWSDPNGMTGPDAPCGPTFVETSTGPPWPLNRWGQKMFSLVSTLAGSPTLPGSPTVSIAAPTTGTAGTIVTINATTATGGSTVTISKVDFLIDGVVAATRPTPVAANTYQFLWTAVGGTHTMSAVVTQSDGKTANSNVITITVTGTSPPTATLFMSTTTAQSGAVITFSSTATPASGQTITQVDFLVDNIVVATDTSAPYSVTWVATTGSHQVRARALQSDNQTGLSPAGTLNVTTTPPPSGGSGLLHVSGRKLVDANNQQVFLKGVNQYHVTPYPGSGVDSLFTWFDQNRDRVADDWRTQGINILAMPIRINDTSTGYKDWVKRVAITNMDRGIYVIPRCFEGFNDDYNSGAAQQRANILLQHWNWCGKPSMMMLNLWNEPNNGGSLSNSQWRSSSEAARQTFRSGGYNAPIFYDANIWATVNGGTNGTGDFTALLANDAGAGGNIVFTQHRYHALCSSGYLPTNWATSTGNGGWNSNGVCWVYGEFGWHNCYNDPSTAPAFLQDIVTSIINAKAAGQIAGAWAWMWTWADENAIVQPAYWQIQGGAAWNYGSFWGQQATRLWKNT